MLKFDATIHLDDVEQFGDITRDKIAKFAFFPVSTDLENSIIKFSVGYIGEDKNEFEDLQEELMDKINSIKIEEVI